MRNENAVADFRAGYGRKNTSEGSENIDNIVTDSTMADNNDVEGSR